MKLNFALLFLLIPSITFSAQLEVGENLLTNFGPEFSDYDNYQPLLNEGAQYILPTLEKQDSWFL